MEHNTMHATKRSHASCCHHSRNEDATTKKDMHPEAGAVYTCPMHPEITQNKPGTCPICGMALERTTPVLQEGPDPELVDMKRRFWLSLVLTIPLLIIAMGAMVAGFFVTEAIPSGMSGWIELALASPVVLWGALPFFQRGW